jgi:Zn-dependent peptidase ImmA (M78 family)
VNPRVLRWARETAGLSKEQIAARLKKPLELVEGWERGDEVPSVSLLKELARLYKRPLAVLLLPEPPEAPPLPIDFRRIKGAGKALSTQSLLVLRHARRLQGLAAELEEDERVAPVFTPGSYSIRADPAAAANQQRALLGVDLASQLHWGDRYRAFREWRAAVENIGIFVYQFRMPVEEVRGFSLSEGGPPTIVLNRSDDIRARIFTLFHEYAHLLLGAGAICLPEVGALLRKVGDSREERFCNEFAGSLLVPQAALRNDSDARELARMSDIPDDVRFSRLVERYQVNRPVLLLRLHSAGMLTTEQLQAKWSQWESQFQDKKEGPRRRGGPAERRPQRCVREFGSRFPALVLDAQADGRVSMAEALDYLSIRLGERDEVADLLAGAG